MNMVDRSGVLVRWVHRFCEGREWVYEWKVMNRSREGLSGRLRWNERSFWNGTERKRP